MIRPHLLLVPGLLLAALALPPGVTPLGRAPVGGAAWSDGPDLGSPGADPRPGDARPRPHPLSDAEVAAASATIDQLVAAGLAANGQQPNPPIDEPTFLRRAYLAVVGRIPTVEEATAYLADRAPDRRTALIAKLQQQPGRAHHDFTWWADLLRISSSLNHRYPGEPYIAWIKERIRANTPYDQVVRALLTADGPVLARGNGATGYYVRDAGMPLDNLANTVQVFLGTRIQCAQCHDHPFDKWTRHDFYQLAAYTASIAVRREERMAQARRQLASDDPKLKNALQLISKTVVLTVDGGNRGVLELPKDYQYKDGAPGQKVPARALFGDPAPVAAGGPAKTSFADWLTAPGNPRFTQVIANRMWQRAFGRGLIDPVDNLTDSSVADDPALLAFLTKLMVSVDYDLLRFQRILLGTAAWQRAASPPDSVGAPGAAGAAPGAAEAWRIAGPLQRRMSAEQLWDSLLTLQVDDPEAPANNRAEPLYRFYEASKDLDGKGLFALAERIAGSREKRKALDSQARTLRTQIDVAKDPEEQRTLRARLHQVQNEQQELRAAAGEGNDPGQLAELRRRPRDQDALLRADDLVAPTLPGHFLRTFGQSDRTVIEAANREPSTTQALTLLNGVVDDDLFDAQSRLAKRLTAPGDAGSRIDLLFLAILSRPPTADERTAALAELARGPAAGGATLRDLAWVLVNSHEFLFAP